VAHAYNPSYSGGRDQEDRSSKPAQANSLRDPISKMPNTKKAGRVAQGVGPELKPQYRKKKSKFASRQTHCDYSHRAVLPMGTPGFSCYSRAMSLGKVYNSTFCTGIL
jgi:hypothetical protein